MEPKQAARLCGCFDASCTWRDGLTPLSCACSEKALQELAGIPEEILTTAWSRLSRIGEIIALSTLREGVSSRIGDH
jgi:hypothetical protein